MFHSTFVEFSLIFGWLLLWSCYNLLRKLLWKFNGLEKKLSSIRTQCSDNNVDIRSLHEVGQVEKIHFRYSSNPIVEPEGLYHFITTHEKFVNIDYIIKKPNVTLYCVNETKAVFVETGGEDVYNMEIGGAFSRNSQYAFAQKVISIPLNAFIALGREIGRPKYDPVFIVFTMRCGSTLIMQALHQTGKFRLIGEPGIIYFPQTMKLVNSNLDESMIPVVMEAVINTLSKPVNGEHVRCIMKLPIPGVGNLPMIKQLFPNAKVMFSYRKGTEVLQSCCNLWPLLPAVWMIVFFSYFPRVRKQECEGHGVTLDLAPTNRMSCAQVMGFIWACNIRFYLRNRERYNIPAFRFKDLIDNTQFTFKQIFDFLEVEYDSAAVERAMSYESQINTPYRMAYLARVAYQKDTSNKAPGMMAKLNQICERLDVPSVEEDLLLPGTISFDDKS